MMETFLAPDNMNSLMLERPISGSSLPPLKKYFFPICDNFVIRISTADSRFPLLG